MAQTLDAKGNVISQGISTNMSPAQFASSNNGRGFQTPSAVSTMPSAVATNAPFASITQVPKIQGAPATTPAPVPMTNDSQVALSNLDVIRQQQAELAATQEAQMQGRLSSSIYRSLGLDGSVSLEGQKAQSQQQLEQEQGLDAKTAYMNSLSSQIKGLDFTDQANKQRILASPIGGITQTDLSGRNTELDRLSFIKKMDLTASLFAAQGDVASATAVVEKQIRFKYADKEANLKNMIAYSDMNEKVLGKKGEEIKAMAEAKMKDIQVKKESEATISKMIIEASPNAPADVITRATQIKESGGSAMAVAQALGQYGGDYLKTQLLKAQIDKTKADTRETDAKRNAIGAKMDAQGRQLMSVGGVALAKVTPKELQDLNETQIAKNSLVSLVDSMMTSIDKNGTQVLFGAGAGARGAAKTNLLLAMKNLEKTGALDKGTIDVLSETIPSSTFFATEAGQKAALLKLKETIINKTDEYIGSYRGTIAEIDPRTKRIYEKAVVSGEDDYIRKIVAPSYDKINSESTTSNYTSSFK